jgi:competence protein ComEC
VPASVVATWGPEPLAGLAGAMGTRAVDALLVVLAGLRTAPLAPAVGPLGALGMCAIFLRPRAGFTAAILLLALGLRTRSAGGMEVTFFDVGQGDAALVEFADGQRWLVDGGRGEDVLKALRRRGIRSLDAVIASHADADHADGLLPVVRDLRVGSLQIGSVEGHETLVQAARDRGIPVVIRPTLRGPAISDNDGSVVVRAVSPWGTVLFAGDLEAAGEAVHGEPSTVLKVPHHGAATSSSEAFLARVQPLLAVVPVGANRYGHPDPGVEARYRARNIQLLRTDLDGEITVRFDPEGVAVHSATGPSMRLEGNLRARIPNTPTANAANPMLKPWL